MTLTIDRARQVLDYDPSQGVFTRKVATARNVKVGSVAGSAPKVSGYVYIAIDRKMYLAHRLAWFMTHGDWPKNHIDHINGDKSDNRIANLRDVTRVVNNQNQRKAMATNLSAGLLGARLHKPSGLFMAAIRVDGAQKHLGYFKTPDAAHQAYVSAKREYHEGCTI